MPIEYSELFAVIKAAFCTPAETIDHTVDIDALLSVGKRHQMVPVLYAGMERLGLDPSKSAPLSAETVKAFWCDQCQQSCMYALEAVFRANRIDYMPLKGASLKKLYPASELRLMGDIDILVRESQYAALASALKESGFTAQKETDHEYVWKYKNGVLTELHKRLIPSYDEDYYTYYRNPWAKAVTKDGNCFFMAAEDEYIYLVTHLAKHYRDGGIGLRHVIDIWLYGLTKPALNRNYISSELKKLSLQEFHVNIRQTIDVWFNGKEPTAVSEHITRRIIESGSYGIQEMFDAANASRQSAKSSSVSSAKIKAAVDLVFLPYSHMKKKYPILAKVPPLLPFLWCIRWGDAIINKQGSISRKYARLRKINPSIVRRYNQELEFVGLKFNAPLKRD